MKKNNLTVLLSALVFALMTSINVRAYDFEQDGIYYSLIGPAQVAVVAGDGGEGTYQGHVVIPGTVQHDNVSYTVTEIQDAFFKCPQLISITIPPTITRLYWDAFLDAYLNRIIVQDLEAWCRINFVVDGCFARMDETDVEVGVHEMESDHDMVNLVIPSSITDIHDFTFYKVSTIQSVEIPDHVSTVGKGAFFGCAQLKSLKIGSGVTSIGYCAFNTNYYLWWDFDDMCIIDDVTCLATTPPTLQSKDCFNNATYKHGTLHVPAQSIRAYCTDENWGRFENILPIPTVNGDVNGDGLLDIADVCSLIDLLLHPSL